MSTPWSGVPLPEPLSRSAGQLDRGTLLDVDLRGWELVVVAAQDVEQAIVVGIAEAGVVSGGGVDLLLGERRW